MERRGGGGDGEKKEEPNYQLLNRFHQNFTKTSEFSVAIRCSKMIAEPDYWISIFVGRGWKTSKYLKIVIVVIKLFGHNSKTNQNNENQKSIWSSWIFSIRPTWNWLNTTLTFSSFCSVVQYFKFFRHVSLWRALKTLNQSICHSRIFFQNKKFREFG